MLHACKGQAAASKGDGRQPSWMKRGEMVVSNRLDSDAVTVHVAMCSHSSLQVSQAAAFPGRAGQLTRTRLPAASGAGPCTCCRPLSFACCCRPQTGGGSWECPKSQHLRQQRTRKGDQGSLSVYHVTARRHCCWQMLGCFQTALPCCPVCLAAVALCPCHWMQTAHATPAYGLCSPASQDMSGSVFQPLGRSDTGCGCT